MRFYLALFILVLGLPLFAAGDVLDSLVPPPELPIQKRSLPCLKCNGKGQVTYLFKKGESMQLTKRTSKKIEDNLLRRKCPTCNGFRSVMRMPTTLEMLTLTKEVFNTYRQEQLSKGMLPIGEAFLPKEAYDALSIEARADIARRYPPMCKKCWGLGFTPCRRCDGRGMRIETKNKEKEVLLDDALMPCADCETKGKQECKTCNGAGVPPLCKRCQGIGYMSRTKKGQTNSELCKSCNGSGRR